jgi:hypothetical protein
LCALQRLWNQRKILRRATKKTYLNLDRMLSTLSDLKISNSTSRISQLLLEMHNKGNLILQSCENSSWEADLSTMSLASLTRKRVKHRTSKMM